jgi:hypothetical protein
MFELRGSMKTIYLLALFAAAGPAIAVEKPLPLSKPNAYVVKPDAKPVAKPVQDDRLMMRRLTPHNYRSP